MSRLLIALLPALLLAPACAAMGDDAETLLQGSSGGGDEGDSAGEEEEALVPTSLLECELEMPCEFPFEGKLLDADSGASAFGASDRCAFKTLAGEGPALVQTAAAFSDQVAYLDYAVVAPGLALRQAWGISDSRGHWQNAVFRCELQAPEFFAACAESPAAHCLDPEMWVTSCAPLDIFTCPG